VKVLLTHSVNVAINTAVPRAVDALEDPTMSTRSTGSFRVQPQAAFQSLPN